eukprot:GHVU01097723.1.p2 GENE.GHVU01097723.1~~GHVU01097723.1.p2  ORF type:complete len:111 (-),score=5.29 GHVU01097723.1:339-671(-)
MFVYMCFTNTERCTRAHTARSSGERKYQSFSFHLQTGQSNGFRQPVAGVVGTSGDLGRGEAFAAKAAYPETLPDYTSLEGGWRKGRKAKGTLSSQMQIELLNFKLHKISS